MTKKSRINYLRAISHNVERKKMYKAKKQWVVAGISFLVATGLGVVSGHITTHAATNNPTVTSNASGNMKQSSSSVGSQAKAMHNTLVNNVTSQEPQISNTQAPSTKASTNPVSNKVNGSQLFSNVSTKPLTTSNVSASGNSMNALNLGTPLQQNKGWNFVQNGIKPSANNGKVYSANQISDKKNKPLMKLAMNLKGTQNIASHGTWGTAKWNMDNNGNLLISDGTLPDNGPMDTGTATNMQSFTPHGWGQNMPRNNNINLNAVTSIKFSNVKAGRTLVNAFTNMPNLKEINFNGLDTSDTQSMYGMIGSNNSLTTIENLNKLDTHNVFAFDSFIGNNNSLTSINLTGFNVSNGKYFGSMISNNKNLVNIKGLNTWNINKAVDMNHMFGNNPKLLNLDLSSFDTTASINNIHGAAGSAGGLNDFISSDSSLRNIKLGPNTILTNQAINGSKTNSYSFSSQNGLIDIANSDAHPGTWTLLQGAQSGNWGNSQLVLDQNGDLIINGNTITDNRNNASINGNKNFWDRVNHIYTKNVNVPSDISGLFKDLESLHSADLTGMNTANVTNINGLFQSDNALSDINVNGLNMQNLQYMNGAFALDGNLSSLDLSSWNTPNLQQAEYAIDNDNRSHNGVHGNTPLKTLNLGGNFNNSNLADWQNSGLLVNDSDLSTLILGNNTKLNNAMLQGTWINLDSDNPQSVDSTVLTDGKTHVGTWTRNAKIINLQASDGNIVYTQLIKAPFGTSSSIENTPIFVPMEYKLKDPLQSFTYDGKTISVPVKLAASDVITSASALVHSDYEKVNDLNINDRNDSFADTPSNNQVGSISADFNKVSQASSAINGDKTTENSSDAESQLSNANAAYDDAYSANAVIESMMNTSLSSASQKANEDESSASSAEKSASNSALSNANSFASALNDALNGTLSGTYQNNSSLTASENSAVSTAAKDYQKWSGASTSAQNGSTQASTTSIFVSDLGNALKGSKFNSNNSLTSSENSVISSAANDYARWNSASNSAETVYDWLTSNNNSNSTALSNMIASASNISASASSAFSVLGLSSGSSYTGSTVLSQLSSINSNLGSASSNDIGYMISQINTDLYSSGAQDNATNIINRVNALSSALGSNLSSASSAISWVETSGSSLMSGLKTGSASATIQNAITSAANSLLATSSGNNSMTGTISSLANSVANSYAKNLVSSSKSGSNTLYSGIVADVASSIANSYYDANIKGKYVSDDSNYQSVESSANSAYANANKALSAIGIDSTGASNNSSNNVDSSLASIDNQLDNKSAGIGSQLTSIENNLSNS